MPTKSMIRAVTAILIAATVQYHVSLAQDKPISKASRRQTVPAAKESQLLVCNIEALTPAQRKRHDEIARQLRKATKQVKDLPNGYAFRYAPDTALFMAAAEFITMESKCCSFYHFSLEKEAAKGPMWLRITGSKEAMSIIKTVLAP